MSPLVAQAQWIILNFPSSSITGLKSLFMNARSLVIILRLLLRLFVVERYVVLWPATIYISFLAVWPELFTFLNEGFAITTLQAYGNVAS